MMLDPDAWPADRITEAVDFALSPAGRLRLEEREIAFALEIDRLRTELAAAHARGIAEGLERAAQWHDEQCRVSDARVQALSRFAVESKIAAECERRQRHRDAAIAIRALPHDPIKADEWRG